MLKNRKVSGATGFSENAVTEVCPAAVYRAGGSVQTMNASTDIDAS